jgi:diguanylate cyclase (GGDEF)-like protein
MIDVDDFKGFNDNYGHQMGDECLIRVAGELQAQMQRSTDMVVRYGGEEFMLILPNTDHQGAMQVAENARLAIEALDIEHSDSSTSDHITVSVGSATAMPGDRTTTEQLVYAADLALYRAKESGRNRTEAAG